MNDTTVSLVFVLCLFNINISY